MRAYGLHGAGRSKPTRSVVQLSERSSRAAASAQIGTKLPPVRLPQC